MRNNSPSQHFPKGKAIKTLQLIRMKNNYFALFMLISMIILSCGNGNSIDTLYKHRQDLLDEFQNKSIITRGENFIALSYHNNEYVNTFYFQKLQDSFIMTNDTLEFPANQIPAFININNGDSVSLKIAVTNELNR
jgi:hypothetical protein